ncbi:PD-(D/E)XK nuclease family protein [Burkholderia vietnamiensis]|uniref:PD-(D/E)XK nuclease superfamily protein n=1 Tax=Burkholderia vietnamiensis (strain G4 / LMG 22486) TaxID=269482 RepID=A4JSH4_BURVG|nr:hypothetical protein Bcep1808_6327 [Burkholderia vietnamiensis G4]MCB4347993.1 PD-(D/E)XK nuclease family protein [Burkholderia vietnamiensis]
MVTRNTGNSSRDGAWSTFFEHFESFDRQRKNQKYIGLNDYSLLGSVLRFSDEVRLHSRFLFSMLNPAGQHFRNSAFGEAFMLALGYPDWLDWSKVRVFREYNYVDIYLTDGKRHVLVENKLNANDQHGQVRRYIDWVRAVNDEREMPTESDDILFVYLSNGRAAPTRTSLHPYKICASPSGLYVVDEGQRKLARFVNAHYRHHVLSWISTCLDVVRDITNLHNAFTEYRLVVERVTKTYKSRVMSLEAFLLEDSQELDSRSRIRHALEIAKKIPLIKANWLASMFEEGLINLLGEDIDKGLLAPITAGDGKELERFQFARQHADLFFAEKIGRDVKDKGRFWRILAGPLSNSVALAVLFGARNLHIGVLPVRVSGVGVVELDKSQGINEFKLVLANQVFEFRRHAPINKVLPGLVSWAVPLEDEIENLARFPGSRQETVTKGLLEHILHGSASLARQPKMEHEGLS